MWSACDHGGMPPSLMPRRCRPAAVVLAVAGAALVVVLSVIIWHGTGTALDDWVFERLRTHIGPDGAARLLAVSTPLIDVGVLAVVAVGGAIARRWDVTALALVGPLLALGLTEVALKPLVGRTITPPDVLGGPLRGALGDSPAAFPSGHETGVASVAAVLLVMAAALPLRWWWRGLVVAVLTAWVVLAGVGLVRNRWHYTTDVIGALGVCAMAVVTAALLIDRYAPRLLRP